MKPRAASKNYFRKVSFKVDDTLMRKLHSLIESIESGSCSDKQIARLYYEQMARFGPKGRVSAFLRAIIVYFDRNRNAKEEVTGR